MNRKAGGTNMNRERDYQYNYKPKNHCHNKKELREWIKQDNITRLRETTIEP